jgi:lipopolysaccharide transport system permease protein
MTTTETTYEPDNSLKKGYFKIFKEIFGEIKKNRWLIYQLFRRDFLTIYRQSIFGILWAFVVPLFSVSVFLVLNQSGVFQFSSGSVPYPVFALLGLAFWQLFSTGLVASSSSLVQAGSMITKINFSKKALVIASLGKTMISFLIQFALALIAFAYFGVLPNIGILLTPILFVPLILTTLGLSFILSILYGVLRDLESLLPIIMTFMLFLTPIMYAIPTTGLLAQITLYNPLYYLVSVPRDIALTGESAGWLGFLVSSALSVIVFLVCLVAFHLTETRLAERL